MTGPLGAKRWAIAEGYIPAQSTGPAPQMTSHETVCILNAGPGEAQVEITEYFADRGPPRALQDVGSGTAHTACAF